MALTKVGGELLQSPLNVGVITATGFSGDLTGNVTGDVNAGVITATSGIQGIGIHSGGVAIHSGIITALNFVGTGNTFAVHNNRVDISISGGGGGGASLVYDSTVFAYKNVIDSDVTLELPHKTALIYADPEVTVDIEPNVTLTVDDGVFFSVVDV